MYSVQQLKIMLCYVYNIVICVHCNDLMQEKGYLARLAIVVKCEYTALVS